MQTQVLTNAEKMAINNLVFAHESLEETPNCDRLQGEYITLSHCPVSKTLD